MQLGNFIKGFKQLEGEPASHAWTEVPNMIGNTSDYGKDLKMIEINNVNNRVYTGSNLSNVTDLAIQDIKNNFYGVYDNLMSYGICIKTKSGKYYRVSNSGGESPTISYYYSDYFSSWGEVHNTTHLTEVSLSIANLKVVAPVGEVIDSIAIFVSFHYHNQVFNSNDDSQSETIGNSTIIATPTIINL